MKKVLIILGSLLLLFAIAFMVLRSNAGMEMPKGESGAEADALAMRMMAACESDAWDQTRFVQWTFAGRNSYIWDRSEGTVQVDDGKCTVLINSNTGEGIELLGGECTGLTGVAKSAWSNFCNDSFWLVAPFKVMDPETRRELVQTDQGPALLVHYDKGGVTPGDSYLWYFGADYDLPYAYRMWTSILPVPGMEATWENWTTLHTGAKVAATHNMGPMTLEMSNLRSASTLEELQSKSIK